MIILTTWTWRTTEGKGRSICIASLEDFYQQCLQHVEVHSSEPVLIQNLRWRWQQFYFINGIIDSNSNGERSYPSGVCISCIWDGKLFVEVRFAVRDDECHIGDVPSVAGFIRELVHHEPKSPGGVCITVQMPCGQDKVTNVISDAWVIAQQETVLSEFRIDYHAKSRIRFSAQYRLDELIDKLQN